jgi:hypothetical protein
VSECDPEPSSACPGKTAVTARVLTSASARTVPAGCESDDLTAQNSVAVAANARGMVVG